MIRQIKIAITDFLKLFIIYLPGETGRKIRYWYYKKKFKRCGNNLKIEEGVIITNPEWISIGENVWIDRYSLLTAGPLNLHKLTFCKEKKNKDFLYQEGDLIIEDNVHISPFCTLLAHGGIYIGKNSGIGNGVKIFSITTLSNNPRDQNQIIYTSAQNPKTVCRKGAVVLGENIAASLYSVYLPGISIGKNSGVYPLSVVFTSFPENSYLRGNPAKKIKDRFNNATNI